MPAYAKLTTVPSRAAGRRLRWGGGWWFGNGSSGGTAPVFGTWYRAASRAPRAPKRTKFLAVILQFANDDSLQSVYYKFVNNSCGRLILSYIIPDRWSGK